MAHLLLVIVVEVHLLFFVHSVVGHSEDDILDVFIFAATFGVDTMNRSFITRSHHVFLLTKLADPFITTKGLLFFFLWLLFNMLPLIEILNLWLTL